MQVIVDTNILISAIIRDRIPEEVISFIIQNPEIEWVASKEILKEYNEVLGRKKFGLSADTVADWKNIFRELVTVEVPDNNLNFPRDPKDTCFLACAAQTGAEYLITGDKDLRSIEKFTGTKIISAAQFKKTVMKA
ncbi:MAG: putative toxin-antitoxin system toxin component, PIN family [Candidatus Wallbacteria bacterium]|nr:putative toxin-antitoxin system toxin component, PIN family [Candidatus Wallbacteria bacterium]